MLDCLILGDSIAVGVSQIRKECVAYVKSGINSRDFYNKHKTMLSEQKQIGTTIISIGPNDTKSIDTIKYANLIRENIKGKVYWILPSETKKPEKFEIIKDFLLGLESYIRDAKTYMETDQHGTEKLYFDAVRRMLK
jgi:hypothetical protein